jgi:lipopolysaccharide export LptBFGC system permease protein LptF
MRGLYRRSPGKPLRNCALTYSLVPFAPSPCRHRASGHGGAAAIAGAFVAAYIGRALGWYTDVGEGPGIVAAIVGSLLLLGIYRALLGMRRTP